MNLSESIIQVRPVDIMKYNWLYVYFHGNLEQIMETDLVSSDIKLEGLNDGIYQVFNADTPLKLFLWTHPKESLIRRGLICLCDDLKACEFAGDCYQNKKASL